MSQDIPRDASHGSAFDVVARSDDAQRGNVVTLRAAEFDTHPAAALFPLMDVASPEFEDLVADVREHGLRESIRLYEGKILDGRNRYRACRHAGVEPRFEEWSGDSPVLHVLTANFRQRSLTDDSCSAPLRAWRHCSTGPSTSSERSGTGRRRAIPKRCASSDKSSAGHGVNFATFPEEG